MSDTMKCANNDCDKDPMNNPNPIIIGISQIACNEICEAKAKLQNIYAEEKAYYDTHKNLGLDFNVLNKKGHCGDNTSIAGDLLNDKS